MRKIILSFFLGFIAAGVAGWFLVARPMTRGSAEIYATSVEEMANTGIQIMMGEQERHLKNLESALPGLALGIDSFPRTQASERALKKIRAFYETSGKPVPPDVARLAPDTTAETESHPWKTRVGDPVPFGSLEDLNGAKLDFKGKVVVLDFFATWCGPCMEEMPHLQKLSDTLKRPDFLVVAVGRKHSAEELRKFQQSKSLSLPLVADPDGALFKKFAEQSIPRTLVVGKDGKIKRQEVGFMLEDFHKLAEAAKAELR